MIQLVRDIAVSSFDAEATIALGRDRPELLTVARLAADAGRGITGRDVARELLGGLPDHVGWRVIDRCVNLGLLVQRGDGGPAAITESGVSALEHRQVLVPEEGAFRFYFADDPLLPAPLLHVSPIRLPNAPDTRRELRAAKDRGERPPAGVRAPPTLVAVRPRVVLESVVNGSVFELREAPTVGEQGPSANARLELRWEATGAPALHVTGTLVPPGGDAAQLKAEAKLEVADRLGGLTYDGLWSALIEFATKVPSSTLEQWRQMTKRRVLPLPFSAVADDAKRTFARDVAVPAVRFGKLGDFQASRIPKVEVLPASQADAQEWCTWLQWDGVSRGYVTPADLEAAAASIRGRFPHHSPRPMSAAELLQRAHRERADRRSWHLLAPADLGLWSIG